MRVCKFCHLLLQPVPPTPRQPVTSVWQLLPAALGGSLQTPLTRPSVRAPPLSAPLMPRLGSRQSVLIPCAHTQSRSSGRALPLAGSPQLAVNPPSACRKTSKVPPARVVTGREKAGGPVSANNGRSTSTSRKLSLDREIKLHSNNIIPAICDSISTKYSSINYL